MKKTLLVLGTCAVLASASPLALAHGDRGGDALLGGVVGGIIGATILGAPYYPAYSPGPVVVERYDAAPPVIVERYAPPPVIIERYYQPAPRIYYRDGGRGWHDRGRSERHWHGDHH